MDSVRDGGEPNGDVSQKINEVRDERNSTGGNEKSCLSFNSTHRIGSAPDIQPVSVYSSNRPSEYYPVQILAVKAEKYTPFLI